LADADVAGWRAGPRRRRRASDDHAPGHRFGVVRIADTDLLARRRAATAHRDEHRQHDWSDPMHLSLPRCVNSA
jgi:hypothetical protein